jgi:hypothetical protein
MAEEPVSYRQPERPDDAVDSPAREHVRSEAYRLFNTPDFGPPAPPKPAEECPPPAAPAAIPPSP